jgi:hypothetical protein
MNKITRETFDRPFLYDWCFPDRILNVTFDGVLMLLRYDSPKNSKVTRKE